MKRFVISGIITVILGFLFHYLMLPAFNLSGHGMWLFLLLELFIFACIFSSVDYISGDYDDTGSIIIWCIVGVVFVVWILTSWFSSSMFQSSTYANRITVTEKEFTEDVPEVDDIKTIALMDTASAKILGDRTMGTLTDLISQYNVSDKYYTIEIKGEMWKIAPLDYAGFWKYQNNKYQGIPGYVKVNPITSESEFVRLEKGFTISEGAFFSNDLDRALRNRYPSVMFGDKTFQVDDEGNVYWVATVIDKRTAVGAEMVEGAVVLNAVTGSSDYYKLENIPEWVDLVFSGDMASNLYNSFGTLQRGWWNSITTNAGGKKTTDDYGYILRNNDIYIYTGVTSVAKDESNIGFIMTNTRTGEYTYYSCPGAEEYSAMTAAEGMVQNFGYTASFPSLVNINGEATYVMVLKDSGGLVKLYAMVNVKNYTIVATGETLSKTLTAYNKALANSGKKVDISSENLNEITFSIADIQFVVTGGETMVYIKGDNGKVYKQDFAANESLILLNIGDKVTVLYETDGDIISIISFK